MPAAVDATCATPEGATHRPVRDAMVSVSAAAVGSIGRTPVESSAITSRTVPATGIQRGSRIEAGSIIAVVPRTGTDKDATEEPLRTIVAVGRAGIRIITIVAIRTNRRGTNISGAYCNPKGNPCVSRNRRQNKDAE